MSSSDAFYDGLGGWGPPRIRFCEAEDVNAFDISVVENGRKALPRVLMDGVCVLEGKSNDVRRRGGLCGVSPESVWWDGGWWWRRIGDGSSGIWWRISGRNFGCSMFAVVDVEEAVACDEAVPCADVTVFAGVVGINH